MQRPTDRAWWLSSVKASKASMATRPNPLIRSQQLPVTRQLAGKKILNVTSSLLARAIHCGITRARRSGRVLVAPAPAPRTRKGGVARAEAGSNQTPPRTRPPGTGRPRRARAERARREPAEDADAAPRPRRPPQARQRSSYCARVRVRRPAGPVRHQLRSLAPPLLASRRVHLPVRRRGGRTPRRAGRQLAACLAGHAHVTFVSFLRFVPRLGVVPRARVAACDGVRLARRV